MKRRKPYKSTKRALGKIELLLAKYKREEAAWHRRTMQQLLRLR